MLQSLKRFLSNLNVVAIQNSLDGFRNTLNVRNNSKTSCWFPFIKRVTSCNWFLAVTEKGFRTAICLKDIRNIFPLLNLRISEDGRQSALLRKVLQSFTLITLIKIPAILRIS